ncbi:LuxR C-terminal-related transcriptional regulator [Plantibacter sp. YIM 135249]|uniref:LuxR C-terminal-related transcriptional regulator n=1 Tax=Plantibacter sp. YIM 135249 TaxID=3423918 RepID=UPI003D327D90
MVTAGFVPQRTVDRPELRERLNGALDKRLTLLVAPAGSGKSVLLQQWRDGGTAVPAVWLELGRADNDPVHCARRLLQALRLTDTEVAMLSALVMLGAGGLGTQFIDELVARVAQLGEVVIVLDDFHHLSNGALVTDLDLLIRAFPISVHTVVATRSELPTDLSAYRLAGELVELRQLDLAMDETHSAALLELTSGRSVSPDNVRVLVEKTEGWPTGLQLAGLTLSMRADADAFVRDFSGSDRLVSDYLSQQVLASLSPQKRRALLRLSALDDMHPELVAATMHESGDGPLFEELERNALFVTVLDDRREWFRFHHLFRDLLRYQLRAEHPEDETRIAVEAARWHLDRGEVDAAVEYFVRSRQWALLIDTILSRSGPMFEQGNLGTVVRWLETVPEPIRRDDVNASLCYAVLIGLSGQGARAEDILVGVATDPTATPGQHTCAETFLAALVQTLPHAAQSLGAASRALQLLAEDDGVHGPDILHLTSRQSLETIATVSGGRACFLDGDIAEARRWLERSLLTEGAAYSLWRINALGALSLVEAWSGRLARGRRLAREALKTAREVGSITNWGCSDAFLALAVIAIESGEPQNAAMSLHEARLRAEATSRTQLLWVCHTVEALLAESNSDAASQESPAGPQPRVAADRLRALRIRARRRSGTDDVARPPVTSVPNRSPYELFELGMYALDHHRLDQLGHSITELGAAEVGEEPLRLVHHEILLARRHRFEGDAAASAKHLAEALTIAGGEGMVEVFVLAGPDVLALVAGSADSDEAFRSRVLRRAERATVPLPGAELQTPLTKREAEVLAYLPGRYSNHELAEKCFVSVNTIKTHMVHIYQKLDAPNRSAAIMRARELGLL